MTVSAPTRPRSAPVPLPQPPRALPDFDQTDTRKLGQQLREIAVPPAELPQLLGHAFERGDSAGYRLARALAETAGSQAQFVAEGQALWSATRTASAERRRHVLRGLLEGRGEGAALFVVHQVCGSTREAARSGMQDYLAAGGATAPVLQWLQTAGRALRRKSVRAAFTFTADTVVDAAGDAAEWLLDQLENGIDAIRDGVETLIDALTDAGVSLIQAFEAVAGWSAEQLTELLVALIEAGVQLVEFAAATFDWSYDAVRNFVVAALAAGLDAAALLEQAVGQPYFVLRRYVSGLFAVLGNVGAVLDAQLRVLEGGAAVVWRSTLLALRYAGADLLQVLNWMAAQSQAIFNALLMAWESIGESLITVYRWALDAGNLVWWMLGEATQTIGNSIYYTYNFLATSGVQYLFDWTRGVLHAHLPFAQLLEWAAGQALEICVEVVRALLAMGTTAGQALAAMVQQPATALQTFVQALLQSGVTLAQLLDAVFVETAQEFLSETLDALLAIGIGVAEIALATLSLGGALLSALVAELFNRIGSCRGLTAAERADALAVFGNSLDYDRIFLSTADPTNAILFGLQDFFTGNPQSRAFVTMNLINFDVGDGPIDRPTLIHELTHVWQAREVGGIYMAQAIGAQTFGNGYNYAYHEAPERLGTGDGVRSSFTLDLRLPVTPGTVAVLTGGASPVRMATDDELGTINFGVGGAAIGSVDYASGALSVTFNPPPAAGTTLDVVREVDVVLGRDGSVTRDQSEGFYAGTGGEAALAGAGGDLTAFNLEQQGQILMHWFVRRFVPVRTRSGTVITYDSSAFDAYQAAVAAA